MYFELFRASVQAVQLLQDAQTRAEQQLLAADLPPLRLDETEPEMCIRDSYGAVTIGNTRRAALRINSGILFLYVNRENLRILDVYKRQP